MGIARLLSRLKLVFVICFVVLGVFVDGCKEDLLKYEYFIEKPTVVKKGDTIEINLGYTRASANWVKASCQIEDNVIYVSGKLVFHEISQTLAVKIPDRTINYKVFWIDDDGKKTEIYYR